MPNNENELYIRQVYTDMSADQQAVVHYMIGEAVKEAKTIFLGPEERYSFPRAKLRIITEGIQLRNVGDEVQVLIKVAGRWKLIISDKKEDNVFTHTVETDDVSEIHRIVEKAVDNGQQSNKSSD